jgi:hypothetical protein
MTYTQLNNDATFSAQARSLSRSKYNVASEACSTAPAERYHEPARSAPDAVTTAVVSLLDRRLAPTELMGFRWAGQTALHQLIRGGRSIPLFTGMFLGGCRRSPDTRRVLDRTFAGRLLFTEIGGSVSLLALTDGRCCARQPAEILS